MPKHPRAELMMQYAQDAMETDEPWERWEVYVLNGWITLEHDPIWSPRFSYRRKQKTININGYEVPEPLRVAPKIIKEQYVTVYVATTDCVDLCCTHTITGSDYDMELIKRGVLHTTRDAAVIHSKALLSFTEAK